MKKSLCIISLLLIFILALTGCQEVKQTSITASDHLPPESSSQNALPKSDVLTVKYIDVGQADCMLITQGGFSMLIDAGNNADGEMVVEYLKNLGISKLDYVVGTHPHEDHIGGLDNVINEFEIGQIIMPKVSHTSKTYKDVLTAVQKKGPKITAAKAGQSYSIGSATAHVLSPVKDKYDGLNEYSVVIRLTYGDNAFLFTGDIEKVNENELLSSKQTLLADVLKSPHHGSRTSNTQGFINAVQPKYGVICVGKDNSYGHPHSEVLKRLENHMTVYRTDKNGTITVTSNGTDINIETEKQE